MTIQNVHWRIKERSNKLNSNHYTDLLPAQIDEKINQAIIFFMEHFAYVNKLPFEEGMQRLDMLSPLVRNLDVPVSQIGTNKYKLDLASVPNYAHTVRVTWTDSCNNNSIVAFKRHDALGYALQDKFQQPSKVWKRGLATMEDSSIILYSYETLTEVNLTYIKQANQVFFGGYDSVDYLHCVRNNGSNCGQYYNQSTNPVEIELHSQYHDLIVDISVYLITGKTENYNLKNIIQEKISQVV